MTQLETIGPVSHDAKDGIVLQTLQDAAEDMALEVYDNWQAYLAHRRPSFSAYFGLSDRVHAEALPIFAELAGVNLAYQTNAIVEEKLCPYQDTDHCRVFYRKQNVARLAGSILQAEIQRSQGQDRDVKLYTVQADEAPAGTVYIAGQSTG